MLNLINSGIDSARDFLFISSFLETVYAAKTLYG
jgi:hypothetical protein